MKSLILSLVLTTTNAYAHFSLETSVSAWEDRSSTSNSGFVSNLKLGKLVLNGVHSGISYDNFTTDLHDFSSLGIFLKKDFSQFSASISLLTVVSNKKIYKNGINTSINYRFSINKTWAIGPKVTYRIFKTNGERFSSIRPMFFSNIKF